MKLAGPVHDRFAASICGLSKIVNFTPPSKEMWHFGSVFFKFSTGYFFFHNNHHPFLFVRTSSLIRCAPLFGQFSYVFHPSLVIFGTFCTPLWSFLRTPLSCALGDCLVRLMVALALLERDITKPINGFKIETMLSEKHITLAHKTSRIF